MASPLPTSTVGPPSSTGQVDASSGAAALLSKVTDSVKFAFHQSRPWSEMVDRTSFSRFDAVSEATSRVRKNISYFKVNYAICVVAFVILSMLWNVSSLVYLFFLGLLWGWLFMVRSEPLTLGGRTLSENELFFGMVVFSLLVVFVFTSVGYVLLTAVSLASLGIVVHAAFRQPDELFSEGQEPSGGFLSFLGPAAAGLPSAVGHV
ncbi:hypothetical protein CBR_g8580 [Chara braunii]|uniref:PRA1 family protein n=1 Tax=Chara braunii TaxID=69332 RepID=A0A388JS11_CHABU|nr:hypothetical protein CBR_g8580 [Chara braunii]|eukprot:GBG60557.1 hypothetical protein CBR_g8580 [Chara braunii]